MGILVLATVFGLVVLGPIATAIAVPLNVRARALVELDHRRTRDGIEIEGRLLDDQGEPIAEERVAIVLGEREPESVTTDGEGQFRLSLDRRDTSALERTHKTEIPWVARFPGSRRFSDVVAEGSIDLSRRTSRLTLTLKGDGQQPPDDRRKIRRLLPTDGPLSIVAQLEAPLDAAALGDAEIRLRVGEGAELVGRTGKNGQVAFILTLDQLEAGPVYRVTARFAGDALHVPALAELDVQIQLPTRLTLRVVREGDARRGRYRFSGRLSDQNGPVAGAVVSIEGQQSDRAGAPVENRVVIQRLAATGPDGLFVTAIDARELDDAKIQTLLVQAGFQPASDVHAPTRSRPVLLEVPPPAGVPAGWYLLALCLLIGVAALAHAHRTGALARAWARLLAALSTRKPRLAPATHQVAQTPFGDTHAPVTAQARTDWISGRVIDGHEGVALPALLRVRDAHGETQEVLAGTDGSFQLGPVGAGTCHFEVGAPGYLTREVVFIVPHPGTYDGATWSLIAVKRKLRDILGETVSSLGQDLAWGVDTPREALTRTLAHHAQQHPDGVQVERPLAELTMLVERAHFARSPVESPAVDHAQALQRQVRPGDSK